jgi:hypothetical protein
MRVRKQNTMHIFESKNFSYAASSVKVFVDNQNHGGIVEFSAVQKEWDGSGESRELNFEVNAYDVDELIEALLEAKRSALAELVREASQ